MFVKLAKSKSAFDSILGHYAYKVPTVFAPDVVGQLKRLPLSLPFDIQAPGNESIYSALLLSIVL